MKIWKRISNLGIDRFDFDVPTKNLQLTNRLNYIMFLLMFSVWCILFVKIKINGGGNNIGSFRFLFMGVLNVIAFYMAFLKRHHVSKFIICYLPLHVLVIIPTILGLSGPGSYYYYPLWVIAFSILPLFVYNHSNKLVARISFVYYLCAIIFVLDILVIYSPVNLPVAEVYIEKKFFVILATTSVYIFVYLSIFYLQQQNAVMQNHLQVLNTRLNNKSDKLYEYNEELDAQNEEMKAILESIDAMQNKLIQSEKLAAMGTLTSGLTHEIFNPLNYIYGGKTILEQLAEDVNCIDVNTEVFKGALDAMDQGVERIREMIMALEIFSNKQKTARVPTDFHDLIENSLLFLQKKIEHKVEIVREFNLKVKLMINPTNFQHVVFHVLDNAVFETLQGRHPKVKIETTEIREDENRFAVIAISNTGPNIAIHNFDNLFTPFFTTKEVNQGKGLGLATAYSIVKERGGDIFAENLYDGVVFRIKVPID